MATAKQREQLVRECYSDVMDDLRQIYELEQEYGEPITPNTGYILRDWKCCAAELWDDMTVEEVDAEFDRLYLMIDEEALQRAQAYA